MKNSIFGVLTLYAIQAQAQFGTCSLIKDIASAPNQNGAPIEKVVFKNKIYFQASNGATNGAELWVTDGTESGTTLVKDLFAGPTGSEPQYFMEYKGFLYFAATTAEHGTELWRTNGTAAGTTLFKDIYPNSSSSSPSQFAVIGDKLVFQAMSAQAGSEPWVTDGTIQGTQMLKNINTSTLQSGHSYMTKPVVFKGKGYFAATDSTNGSELWVTDGTPAGTKQVRDIYKGNKGSEPSELTIIGNQLFFTARDSANGIELWKTDGTKAGTVLVKDIYPGMSHSSSPNGLTAFGNQLIFGATDSLGTELWISDGTVNGTKRVKNIADGIASSKPTGMFVFKNHVYFQADNGESDVELWQTNGTEAGTSLFKNINATGASNPQNFVAYGTKMYFRATDGSNGAELWESDGTATNTRMACEFITGSKGGYPNFMMPMLGSLYMSAQNDTSGVELFRFRTALGVNTQEVTAKSFTLTAKPTLTTDQTRIEIDAEHHAIGHIRVSNLLGQAFFEKTMAISQGNQHEWISLATLPNGLYFVTLSVGDEYRTLKIVKE
jgi:trimeric autotransporter adhesin